MLNHGERVVKHSNLAHTYALYARAIYDAQRPFQRVPEHSWSTQISTGTSQSKGGDREIECCIFRLAEKRCPLTRDAQLKKYGTLLYFWSNCRAPITLKLTQFLNNMNPNKRSVTLTLHRSCKQNCGSFSKLIFNRPKFFWWVQVGYAEPRR